MSSFQQELEHTLRTRLPSGVSRETVVTMLGYCNLISVWNQKVNLTGAKTPLNILNHIIDCSHAYHEVLGPHLWIDIGSGAGFPGMVWAIQDPLISMKLIEPNQKRNAFLHRVKTSLKLSNVEIYEQRWEKLAFQRNALVSRGTWPPREVVALTKQKKFQWDQWVIFSTQKTHSQYLTLLQGSAIKIEKISYPGGLLTRLSA